MAAWSREPQGSVFRRMLDEALMFGIAIQGHHQHKRYGSDMDHAQQPEPADLDQPGKCSRRRGVASLDDDLVVGDQRKASIDQAKQQIGFSGSWATKQQHGVTTKGTAAAMHHQRC